MYTSRIVPVVLACVSCTPRQLLPVVIEQNSVILEFDDAQIVDGVLRGRLLIASREGLLRLGKDATFCFGLFELESVRACDGRNIGWVHGDCTGDDALRSAIDIEPGTWIGQNVFWHLSERQLDCVDATIQVFFDGRLSRSRPGGSIHVRFVDGRIR